MELKQIISSHDQGIKIGSVTIQDFAICFLYQSSIS
jgi:hypothetical protein